MGYTHMEHLAQHAFGIPNHILQQLCVCTTQHALGTLKQQSGVPSHNKLFLLHHPDTLILSHQFSLLESHVHLQTDTACIFAHKHTHRHCPVPYVSHGHLHSANLPRNTAAFDQNKQKKQCIHSEYPSRFAPIHLNNSATPVKCRVFFSSA